MAHCSPIYTRDARRVIKSLHALLFSVVFRLEIIKTMSNFFRSVILLSPDDLSKCLYLSLNKVAPAWEGIELGVGDRIVTKSIVEATGEVNIGK